MTTTPAVRPSDMVEPLRQDAQGRYLCSARRSNGEACRAPAMRGMRVCRVHGGSSPQAKRKAALRLAELVDPAITTLAKELVNQDAAPSDRLRAANSILDRAGVPRVTREVDAETSREVLVTRLRELRQSRDDGTVTVERTAETVRSRDVAAARAVEG